MARAYVRQLDVVGHRGLLLEYVQRVESTSFPKGRLLPGLTLTRHRRRGQGHLVTVAWTEQSKDNGPNRLLRYAVRRLAAVYRSRPGKFARELRLGLNRADRMLDGVELDFQRGFLSHPMVAQPSQLPEHREHYRTPIALAKPFRASGLAWT